MQYFLSREEVILEQIIIAKKKLFSIYSLSILYNKQFK